MDKQIPCKIIKFADGTLAMLSGTASGNASITMDDNAVTEEKMIDVTHADLPQLRENIASNNLDFDTMRENTSIMNTNTPPATPSVEVIHV